MYYDNKEYLGLVIRLSFRLAPQAGSKGRGYASSMIKAIEKKSQLGSMIVCFGN